MTPSKTLPFVLAAALAGCTAEPASDASLPEGMDRDQASLLAVAAVFGEEAEVIARRGAVDRLLDAVVPAAHAEDEDGDPDLIWDTCSSSPPGYVTSGLTGVSGTFGPNGSRITLDADTDYCQDPSGADIDNSGDTQYRSFTIESVTISCSWGASWTATASGVYRNNPTGNEFPAVYGTFELDDGSGPETYDCNITTGEGNSGADGDSDDGGEITDATCKRFQDGALGQINQTNGSPHSCTIIP